MNIVDVGPSMLADAGGKLRGALHVSLGEFQGGLTYLRRTA